MLGIEDEEGSSTATPPTRPARMRKKLMKARVLETKKLVLSELATEMTYCRPPGVIIIIGSVQAGTR